MMPEPAEFDEDADWLKLFEDFKTLIERDYGYRCQEVEGGCPNCGMWALYDLLLASVCIERRASLTEKGTKC